MALYGAQKYRATMALIASDEIYANDSNSQLLRNCLPTPLRYHDNSGLQAMFENFLLTTEVFGYIVGYQDKPKLQECITTK